MEVNDIPWNKLIACGGHSDPTLIPNAIERLFSSDQATRVLGYWGIDNHAVVQGDLYSTAPYVARLVVDHILMDAALSAESVNILVELALGDGDELLTEGPLSGRSLAILCRVIVRELEPLFETRQNSENHEIANLLLSLTEIWADQDDV